METFKKQLKALEAKSGTEGLVLTEAQVVALKRAKEEKQLTERLKLIIRNTWELRIPTTLAPSKELAEFISKPSLIHIPK